MQLVGNHPKWKSATVVAFVPILAEDEKGKAGNVGIVFAAVPYQFHAGREVQVPMPTGIMTLREHAIERLFQRLNSTSAAVVSEEIHDALCMAASVSSAAQCLGLRQVVLPTRSGFFLCNWSASDEPLQANTWIQQSESSSRFDEVVDAVRTAYIETGGAPAVAAAMTSMSYGSEAPLMEPHPAMVACLNRFPMLKAEYVPRVDHVGEVWERAKRQMEVAQAQGAGPSDDTENG